jgi:acetyltransferase-like isoleucine patch superfamily enzyme
MSSSQAPSGGVQATAQLALSHTQFSSDRPRRQKEEMLNGRPYFPFDKELVLERERCNAACWRFNNSTNPNLGVSPAERARLFRDILHPREGVQLSPTMVSPVTHAGRVGDNVTVEAPFNCDYGYNIHIGSNVSIGRNCLINDVCEVRIGNNVVISPNVCVYTGTCSTNPERRRGNQGMQYGKPVIIEDDVWIAANVVILPGVRIGKGSTVGAGSVVTRVSPYHRSQILSEWQLTGMFAGCRHLECLHGPQGRPPQGDYASSLILSLAA